jgi:hypothetical protein
VAFCFVIIGLNMRYLADRPPQKIVATAGAPVPGFA